MTPPPVRVPRKLQEDPESRTFFDQLTKALYIVWSNQRQVNHGPFLELTVASGAITIDQGYLFSIIGEGVAADDLATISGGVEGREITLTANADTITFKDGTGNLLLAGDFAADATNTITLVFNGSNWLEKSRSSNA